MNSRESQEVTAIDRARRAARYATTWWGYTIVFTSVLAHELGRIQ